MIRISKYKFGEVRYCDCLDEEWGLPSLDDKSWELCLTDPPYNVGLKGNSQKEHKKAEWSTQHKEDYDDRILGYYNWCERWFSKIKKVCKMMIFTPGHPNFAWWITNHKPKDIHIHYKPNGFGRTAYARFNKYEPILLYGDIPTTFPFKSNVFEHYLKNGFLREGDLIHPCPKCYELWYDIISQLQPKSVIDPFLGSGTTAEVCEKLGIKWLGYEIKEKYSVDIESRLESVRLMPKQIELEMF